MSLPRHHAELHQQRRSACRRHPQTLPGRWHCLVRRHLYRLPRSNAPSRLAAGALRKTLILLSDGEDDQSHATLGRCRQDVPARFDRDLHHQHQRQPQPRPRRRHSESHGCGDWWSRLQSFPHGKCGRMRSKAFRKSCAVSIRWSTSLPTSKRMAPSGRFT